VILLSPLGPNPYVAALVEQTETRILHGSIRPVQSSFECLILERLGFSASFDNLSLESATASCLVQKCSGQTLDVTWRRTISTRAHEGGRCV
jgi:hypothetical protein